MKIEHPNKPYHSSHSLVYRCQYHVIWCPKYRRRVLNEPIATRLKQLIEEKQADYGDAVLGMEIMPDHVHLLLDASPQIGIVSIVGKIKGILPTCSALNILGSKADFLACGLGANSFPLSVL